MTFKKKALYILLGISSTVTAHAKVPVTGIYRAVLSLSDTELPFNMEVAKNNDKYFITIINAKERIKVDEVEISGDSIFARMPIFDSEIRAKINADNLSGNWINHARKTANVFAFKASANQSYRFTDAKEKPVANISGRWEADFSKGTPDSSKAEGEFVQTGNYLSGTFLTTTGDYRYLEGTVQGNKVMLSCFDGSHAFLFTADINADGTMTGLFRSGFSYKEPWVAKKNEGYKLPDPNSLTFLKPGYDKINFSFPDLSGKQVSISDEKYKGKVIIVQIMGSWCPNCMDESKFLSSFYKQKHTKGFEIIGLAYEKATEFAKAVSNVERLKNRFGIDYTLLIAGSSNKEEAAKTLPMLSQILSFPTTIIIDKKGIVRRIHTGYSGPATGKHYDDFVEDFTKFIDKLLTE